jgi:hypothetical protein
MDFEKGLDPTLREGGVLRTICRNIRVCLWLWRSNGPLSEELGGLSMSYYVLWWYSLSLAQLHNHHLEARETLRRGRGDDAYNGLLEDHVEAILAMSLMLYLSTFAGNPRIGGVDVWPKVDMFLQYLQTYLEDFSLALSRQGKTPADLGPWQSAILYAYWVGATWEYGRVTVQAELLTKWFTTGFVDTARMMGLNNWSGVRRVVDGFSDSSFAKPYGKTWVDRAIREGLG